MRNLGIFIAVLLFTVTFAQEAPAQAQTSDVLASINSIAFTWNTKLDSIEARQSAIQRDIFNIRNDTLSSVQTELVNLDIAQTAKLDAMDARIAARMDVMEREKWFILVGSLAANAIMMSFFVMPYLRHQIVILRDDRRKKPEDDTPLDIKPEMPDKSLFINIKAPQPRVKGKFTKRRV